MILHRRLSRPELEMLGMMLEATDGKSFTVAPSEQKWEPVPEYISVPASRDVPEQEVAAALKECGTFFLESRSDSIAVKGDLSPVPNFWMTDVQVKWEELRDAQGRPVPFERPAESSALISISSSPMDDSGVWRADLRLPEGVKAPDRLEGWKGSATASFRVPVQFRTISFKPSDVGATRDGVTLLEWKHGRVVLEDKKGRLGWDDGGVGGFGANGLLLTSSGTVEHPTEFAILRKLAQTPWEQIPAVVPVPQERITRVIYAFKGEPSRVEVSFVERRAVHEVRLQLLPSPTDTLFTSRYVSPPGRTVCEVSAQTLTKQVRIFASRWHSEMTDSAGQPLVVVQLPACANSAWAQVNFEGLKTLRTGGRPLAPVKTKSHSRISSFAWVLAFAPPEGKGGTRPDVAFPQLAQVKGKAQLAIPRLQAVTFSRELLHVQGATLTLKDKSVTLRLPKPLSDRLPPVDENEWTSWFFDGPNPLGAYDAAGRRLRLLEWRRDRVGDGLTVLTASFAGAPDRVELLLLGEPVRVTLPFNVKLPPAPPPSGQDE